MMSDMPVTYINPPSCPPAQGNYSHVGHVSHLGLYYIAGQLSIDDDGAVVGAGDFEKQFLQVYDNLGKVLSGLGMTFNNIVKFNTYFVHSQDISRFMVLRKQHFQEYFTTELWPPNTIAVIDRLVKEDFLLEVEAVAAKQPS